MNLIIFIIFIAIILLCYLIAKKKNLNPQIWILLGMGFSVLALITILFIKPRPTIYSDSSVKKNGLNPVLFLLLLLLAGIMLGGQIGLIIERIDELSPQQNLNSSVSSKIEAPEIVKKEETPTSPTIILSKNQIAFVRAIESVEEEYNAAPNELKKSAIRTKRGKLIRSALNGDLRISGWIGKLMLMKTNSEGKAFIEIQLENTNITIKTWNNAISDLLDNTLIPQESRLYSEISELLIGERVVISGIFLPSDKYDFVREASLTESGSMSSPEFVFKFDAVRKY